MTSADVFPQPASQCYDLRRIDAEDALERVQKAL